MVILFPFKNVLNGQYTQRFKTLIMCPVLSRKVQTLATEARQPGLNSGAPERWRERTNSINPSFMLHMYTMANVTEF